MVQFLPLALGGLSAAMGYQNAQNKNDQMRKQNQAAATQTQYSPWSGMGQGQINNQYSDPMMSAIGSGLQGAAAGQSLGSAFGGGGGASKLAGAADAAPMQYAGQNYLGGQDMAQQLGGQQSPWNFMSDQYVAAR